MSGNTVAVVVHRDKSGVDEYGRDVFTETFSDPTPGIYSPATTSTEQTSGQETVVDQPYVYLPPGTVVAATDAVIPQVLVDADGALVLDGDGKPQGDRYDVDGDVAVWPPNPYTGFRHEFPVDVKLRRQTG